MNATLYTIKLTPGERKALDIVDAEGWKAFWLQFDGIADAECERECHEQDCTPDELRQHAADAKAAVIADDHLTLVADSNLEADIVEHLESAVDGFEVTLRTPAEVRAIRSLLRKLDNA